MNVEDIDYWRDALELKGTFKQEGSRKADVYEFQVDGMLYEYKTKIDANELRKQVKAEKDILKKFAIIKDGVGRLTRSHFALWDKYGNVVRHFRYKTRWDAYIETGMIPPLYEEKDTIVWSDGAVIHNVSQEIEKTVNVFGKTVDNTTEPTLKEIKNENKKLAAWLSDSCRSLREIKISVGGQEWQIGWRSNFGTDSVGDISIYRHKFTNTQCELWAKRILKKGEKEVKPEYIDGISVLFAFDNSAEEGKLRYAENLYVKVVKTDRNRDYSDLLPESSGELRGWGEVFTRGTPWSKVNTYILDELENTMRQVLGVKKENQEVPVKQEEPQTPAPEIKIKDTSNGGNVVRKFVNDNLEAIKSDHEFTTIFIDTEAEYKKFGISVPSVALICIDSKETVASLKKDPLVIKFNKSKTLRRVSDWSKGMVHGFDGQVWYIIYSSAKAVKLNESEEKELIYFGYLNEDGDLLRAPKVGDEVQIGDKFYPIVEASDSFIVKNGSYEFILDETQLSEVVDLDESTMDGTTIGDYTIIGMYEDCVVVSDSDDLCYVLKQK